MLLWIVADREAQAQIERAHPLHVAAGEVVVDRDDVDALAFEGVQIGRQRGDQRLAFAGHHFGDRAAVQHHAADELHVEVPHVQEAAAPFAADGKGFDQHVVERFAGLQPLAKQDRLLAQLGIGHRLEAGLQRGDGIDFGLQPADVAGVGRAEHGRDAPLEALHQAAEQIANAVPGAF